MRDAVKNRPKVASRTGAGPPVPPAPYEELILQILGESTTVDGIVDAAAGDTFFYQYQYDTVSSNSDLTGVSNSKVEQGDLILANDHLDNLEGSQIYNISIIQPETTQDGGPISPSTGLTDTIINERETLTSTPLAGGHCQTSGLEGCAVRQASKRFSSNISRGILKKRKCPNKNEEDCDYEDEVSLTKKFLKAQIAMKTVQMDVLRTEKARHDLEIERLKIENEDRKERRMLERRELELRVKKLEMDLHQWNGSV